LSGDLLLHQRQEISDLVEDVRQVGPLKAELGRRDSIPLDVWWDVFVMGEAGGQGSVLRMGEIVVPVEPLVASIDLVTVGRDQAVGEVDLLAEA
jgi:hypothetical protein